MQYQNYLTILAQDLKIALEDICELLGVDLEMEIKLIWPLFNLLILNLTAKNHSALLRYFPVKDLLFLAIFSGVP